MIPSKATRLEEGRPRPERNPVERARVRTQSRVAWPAHLDRVNEAARRSRRMRFTAVLHHVDVEALRRAYRRQRRRASAGVDGVTAEEYGQDLERNLQDLCDRVHSGRYRPQPVRRVYIPKPDGGERPLGVPSLEDKIVQGAVAEVLSAIYEVDFQGFSYGFRPGRSAHGALDALQTAIMTQKVDWVLDADIRSFFDSVDHEWLLRMVSHRIADRRILRLIRQWLRAGILESGEWREVDVGTPQGAGISPLLANIYLHYVFDLWVKRWRRTEARGQVIVVRYADDFVLGFLYEVDGRCFLSCLRERLLKFGLRLHEDKTRLIEFGRFAKFRRKKRGVGRPETFAFLGFTHYCGESRDGRFIVKRKTQSKRMIRKLKELRREARKRMHQPVGRQRDWLSSVLRGHYAYYGVTGNSRALCSFAFEVGRIWHTVLKRRSQKSGLTWQRFNHLRHLFPLPTPRITRSWQRCGGRSWVTLRKSRMRERRPSGSVRGAPGDRRLYSTVCMDVVVKSGHPPPPPIAHKAHSRGVGTESETRPESHI
jgi:RNA-directed DNA polymerase